MKERETAPQPAAPAPSPEDMVEGRGLDGPDEIDRVAEHAAEVARLAATIQRMTEAEVRRLATAERVDRERAAEVDRLRAEVRRHAAVSGLEILVPGVEDGW